MGQSRSKHSHCGTKGARFTVQDIWDLIAAVKNDGKLSESDLQLIENARKENELSTGTVAETPLSRNRRLFGCVQNSLEELLLSWHYIDSHVTLCRVIQNPPARPRSTQVIFYRPYTSPTAWDTHIHSIYAPTVFQSGMSSYFSHINEGTRYT